MSDTSVFLWINGLAGHVRIIDEFFKGISNDYFALIFGMLVMIWLWFGTRDSLARDRNQRTVMIAMISIGMAATAMALINLNSGWFRVRPFDALPSQVNLIFYPPTDSSFPSNYTAIIFSIALPVLIRNRKYGWWLLALAIVGSFGRIYMGIHYPLDVLGGIGVGILGCGVAFFLGWVLKPLMDLLLKIFRILYIA